MFHPNLELLDCTNVPEHVLLKMVKKYRRLKFFARGARFIESVCV